MPQESFIEKSEENISIHVFAVSAGMVGVCLTVIGIFSLLTSLKKIDSIGDDITGFDALAFLIACIVSYIALKTKNRKRRLLLEKIADIIFLVGLVCMVFICMFLVYVINQQIFQGQG